MNIVYFPTHPLTLFITKLIDTIEKDLLLERQELLEIIAKEETNSHSLMYDYSHLRYFYFYFHFLIIWPNKKSSKKTIVTTDSFPSPAKKENVFQLMMMTVCMVMGDL